jgi:hypothetical protein
VIGAARKELFKSEERSFLNIPHKYCCGVVLLVILNNTDRLLSAKATAYYNKAPLVLNLGTGCR